MRGFRCSDDACTYGYNIPTNMYVAVVLGYIAEIADKVWHDAPLSGEAIALRQEIREGVEKYGTVVDAEFGKMYAYEADGLGNQLLLDDAGVPGLLSAPYYGYCDKDDPSRYTRPWFAWVNSLYSELLIKTYVK